MNSTGVTMRPSLETRRVLEALTEPILVATPEGSIAFANAVARRTLDVGPGRGTIAALEDGHGEPRLVALARQASASTQMLVGRATLMAGTGAMDAKVFAGRIVSEEDGERPLVFLRIVPASQDRFAALTVEVAERNREIAARRRVQFELESALAERNVALSELQHRTRNNIQMIAGMLAAIRRDVELPQARAALAQAERRVAAIAAVHRLLHDAATLAGLPADVFLRAVTEAALAGDEIEATVHLHADASLVDNEIVAPLAVVVYELVSNAIVHGRRDDSPAHVRVALAAGEAGALVLQVADDGPGFEVAPTPRRASGLGLVHGLLRQIGGALSVERENGARVRVVFPDLVFDRSVV